MRIDRRLMLLGVMLVVLSMTMATQYVTTKVGYEFDIVHPSNQDIRFIGSDNLTDGRVLRVSAANASTVSVKLDFGNWSAGSNNTYTAAFGIVNEELMDVNITHINISTTTGSDYTQIWLHGDRDADATSDGSGVFMWDGGISKNGSDTTAWQLAAGDQNVSSMDGSSTTTPWDTTKHVRYSTYDTNAVSGTDDYVWVQVAIVIPTSSPSSGTGWIWIHFESSATS